MEDIYVRPLRLPYIAEYLPDIVGPVHFPSGNHVVDGVYVVEGSLHQAPVCFDLSSRQSDGWTQLNFRKWA